MERVKSPSHENHTVTRLRHSGGPLDLEFSALAIERVRFLWTAAHLPEIMLLLISVLQLFLRICQSVPVISKPVSMPRVVYMKTLRNEEDVSNKLTFLVRFCSISWKRQKLVFRWSCEYNSMHVCVFLPMSLRFGTVTLSLVTLSLQNSGWISVCYKGNTNWMKGRD